MNCTIKMDTTMIFWFLNGEVIYGIYSVRSSGKIVKRCICEFNQLKHSPLGQKVRVTLNDEKQYIGFWDTFSRLDAKIAEINKYDLDEGTNELRSGNRVVTFIQINRISQLEVILYSNPRWGVAPNNKFTFSKSARKDFKLDFF